MAYVIVLKALIFCKSISTNVNVKSRLPNGIEKSYYNPINQREEIRMDNNGKIGVYLTPSAS